MRTITVVLVSIIFAAPVFCQSCEAEDGVDTMLAAMSPAEQLGQLFFLAFDGRTVTGEMKQWIKKRNIGGIALFAKNAASPEKLRALGAALQKLARERGAAGGVALPLFLATDHEPGGFMAIRFGNTFAGPRRLVEKSGSRGIVRAARLLSGDLADWGFNMNFFPVLDVARRDGSSVFDYRCLSSEPETVARIGVKLLRISREKGIIPVAKHFPGHGDTEVDSHKSLPVIRKSPEAFRQRELLPFQAAVEAGVPAIMAAHILYPALDKKYSATLSRKILHELLREKMGFSGIVISDDMMMEAIRDNYSLDDACARALEAGVDMLLITRRFSDALTPAAIYDTLLTRMKRDAAFRRVVRQAAARSIRLKIEMLMP